MWRPARRTSGHSFDDWWKPCSPAPGASEIRPYGEGYVALTRDGIRKYFVQDIPADEADIVFATQGPLAVKCFGDKITEAAWRSKPHGTSLRPMTKPFLPKLSAIPRSE